MMNMLNKFDLMRDVFFKYDPANLGVKENNLKDEYDGEIELIIGNIENLEDSKESVIELLNFVFDDFFYQDFVDFNNHLDLVGEIYNIIYS